MLLILLCAAVVATAQGQDYVYRGVISGWIKLHKEVATWEEAFDTCQSEGAELVSPDTEDLLTEIKAIIEENHYGGKYFIDVSAKYAPQHFVSTKGVSVQNMPIARMVGVLNWKSGRCLGMDSRWIEVVPCETRLPFFCYKSRMDNLEMTRCGTFDKEYKFNERTGSCYKYHKQRKTWSDAYSTCIVEGGHLVILNNAQEARDVQAMIKGSDYNSYIGLRALRKAGDWRSVHGEREESLYRHWHDPSITSNDSKRCAILIAHLGILNCIPCTEMRYFVCEKKPSQQFSY